MRKLTPIEKKAAAAVAGMTVAVIGTGVSLLKKHTDLLLKEAASHFDPEEAKESAGIAAEENTQEAAVSAAKVNEKEAVDSASQEDRDE